MIKLVKQKYKLDISLRKATIVIIMKEKGLL